MFHRFALRDLVPEPTDTHYAEPLWGDIGAHPRWNHASLPHGGVEAFNLSEDEELVALAMVESGFDPDVGVHPDRLLVERTRRAVSENRSRDERQPLEDLLDVLCATAAEFPDEGDPEELAEFSACAADYARHNPAPDWLEAVDNDVALVNRFAKEAKQWPLQHAPKGPSEPDLEVFSLADFGDRLLEAVDRVRGIGGRLTGRALTAAARSPAHRAGAIFLGDVLVYLKRRGTRENPGEIVQRVVGALQIAAGAIDPKRDPKLVVVGHSMGGNILYDVLTHFEPELKVDVFVTVGSQVSLFEELKQFQASDDAVPNAVVQRVSRPQNVGRWINVFDLNDVLGFAVEGVFSGARDFKYSTGEGAIKAHGTYLMLPSFHDRLRERLSEDW